MFFLLLHKWHLKASTSIPTVPVCMTVWRCVGKQNHFPLDLLNLWFLPLVCLSAGKLPILLSTIYSFPLWFQTLSPLFALTSNPPQLHGLPRQNRYKPDGVWEFTALKAHQWVPRWSTFCLLVDLTNTVFPFSPVGVVKIHFNFIFERFHFLPNASANFCFSSPLKQSGARTRGHLPLGPPRGMCASVWSGSR